jgi:transposase-like protein
MSALSLQRLLEIGSYQTAWAMLHRLRSVLVRPGRDRLAGRVEVDETYIGGEEAGLSGGRARGKKVLTGIAVEVREPKGLGRCRMAPLADASAASLHAFVTDHVEPGAVVITDGWAGYAGLEKLGYVHDRRSQRAASALGDDPDQLLPAVHRVASLAKRWLLGTHQGSVDDAHLPSYLNEFAFRFNRRRSRSRGMVFYRVLELAVAHQPVRYRDLIANPRPSTVPRRPPDSRGRPPSIERPRAGRRGGPVRWIPPSLIIRQNSGATVPFFLSAEGNLHSPNQFGWCLVKTGNKWQSFSGITGCPSGGSGQVVLTQESGSTKDFDVSAIQLVQFDTIAEAMSYLRSGIYTLPVNL